MFHHIYNSGQGRKLAPIRLQ